MSRFTTRRDDSTTLLYLFDTRYNRLVFASQSTDLVERIARTLNRLEVATGGLDRRDIADVVDRVLA